MFTRDFDYDLPPGRIAQQPLSDRDASRMMVVHRDERRWEHRRFLDLPEFLRAGDLLALNDTRVRPARVYGRRADTGGNVELLLVESVSRGEEGGGWRVEGGGAGARPGPPVGRPVPRAPRARETPGGVCVETWEALMRSGFAPKPGMKLELAEGRLCAEIVDAAEDGRVTVALRADRPVDEILEACGAAPLPPYIRRERGKGRPAQEDRERYQTIYAERVGAVAAPTAGLHFTEAMFEALRAQGVRRASVTLHVGPGTFKPVRADDVEDHRMDPERFTIPPETSAAVRATRDGGGRVVAVGSTSVRALESLEVVGDRTNLFIRPPYVFRFVDLMLTNFHLPCSTLLMMVAAFAAPGEKDAGRTLILDAYADAVREEYRFYSYGDCMLIV
jgi:S-adenosylmethionine:tRNA ribosyltransferase-isomerase